MIIGGTNGADVLQGTVGDDIISGGYGDDVLHGAAGDDILYGGDEATHQELLSTGVVDPSDGDDTLDGGDGADTLYGGWGHNTLLSGAGNDLIELRGLSTILDAGTGDDLIQFILSTTTGTVEGGAGLDTFEASQSDISGLTFSGVERLVAYQVSGTPDQFSHFDIITNYPGGSPAYPLTLTLTRGGTIDFSTRVVADVGLTLIGSDEADTVTGSSKADMLAGNDGDDHLYGGQGGDTLYGGPGSDLLDGGAGSDHLYGGAGVDYLFGGDGFDYARYDDAWSGVTVGLEYGAMPGTGDAAYDSLIDIEGLMGSRYDDALYASNAGGNRLYGLSGNDVLVASIGGNIFSDRDFLDGGDGDDSLFSGMGGDSLQGGAGFDYARYDFAKSGVVINLATGQTPGDILGSIEGLVGSRFRDILYGDNGDNIFYGEGGKDALLGGAGADHLYGGEGDDHLYGGLGADSLDGGLGFDFARYDDAAAGVTASLATHGGTAGEAQGDVFVDIEGLVGTNFDDTLIGDAGNNTIYGLEGNNILMGGDGSDGLVGGSAIDHLYGGAGADYLDGGYGYDTAHYDDAPSGVIANLDTTRGTAGDALGDAYISIENLAGSNFADELTGDWRPNTLFGLDGDDLLIGGGLYDSLVGGAGDDRLYGDGGSDGGDDHLYGGTGADYLDGGAGFDYARYDFATSGVIASLAAGVGGGGEALGDVYVDIEGLVGSNFADELTGDSGNNRFYGLGGSDLFKFGAHSGADWIYDFQATGADHDVIQIAINVNGSGIVDFASLQAHFNGSVIDLTGGNSINLFAVNLATLNASDFLFV